jgi:hypothetical protein
MLKIIDENILFQFYLLFTLRLKFVSPNFDHFLYVYVFFNLFIDFEIMLSSQNLSKTIENGYTEGNLRRRPLMFSDKLLCFHLYLLISLPASVENYWLKVRNSG